MTSLDAEQFQRCFVAWVASLTGTVAEGRPTWQDSTDTVANALLDKLHTAEALCLKAP